MNFSPSRSSTHGVTGSIACASASARIASKDECCASRSSVAPRRERSAALRRAARARALRQRRASAAPAHSPSITCGCQSPARAARDEEQGVEPPHRVELGHPAGERRQRRQRRAASRVRRAVRAKRLVGDELALQSSAASADLARGESDRYRRFLEVSRIAATAAPSTPSSLASCRSASSIRPPGKTSAPAGEGHAFGAFDHQQLGRPAERSRTTIRLRRGSPRRSCERPRRAGAKKKPPGCSRAACSSAAAALHAADVLLLGVARVDGVVRRAAFSAFKLLCWLPSAAASRWRHSSRPRCACSFRSGARADSARHC